MKRPIRECLKDNTSRKIVVRSPALSSNVLQDRLLDVDLSTKRWRNGTVSTRSQVSQNVVGFGIYLMTCEDQNIRNLRTISVWETKGSNEQAIDPRKLHK